MNCSLRTLTLSLLGTLLLSTAMAQEAQPDVRALRARAKASEARYQSVLERARKLGNAVEIVTEDGTVAVIAGYDHRGMPLYNATETNRNAAATTATSGLQNNGIQGYNLTGQGQRVAIWDGGSTFVTRVAHQEFTGRAVVRDGSVTVDDHATHVAGTMVAFGINPTVRGMAPDAGLDAYSFGTDEPEMATAAAGFLPNGTTPLPEPITISNHSYGLRAGWNGDVNFGAGTTPPWYWLGDTTLSATEDAFYGRYDATAIEWDQIAVDAPNYLIFKSAGNPRATGPSPQPTLHWVFNGAGWSLSSTSRGVRNGVGPHGYDCLTGNANSKNVMTVGAAAALPNGFTVGTTVNMASFSAFGPTDDGRIKPDIVGNGVSVTSSFSGSNTAYGTFSGTSMSSPNVSGSSVLVSQYYKQKFGATPRSSTLKGIILHSADDIVNVGQSGTGWPVPTGIAFNGPDYLTGWGMMNTTRAVGTIAANNLTSFVREVSISQGGTFTMPVSVTGNQPLKVTICWIDPVGTLQPASLNNRTPRLVNDLDLRLLDASGNVVATLPWTLDPNSPQTPAVQNADNIRDNIEQVFIAAPTNGNYTIRVTHKGTLTGGAQPFSLIASGVVSPVVGGVSNAPAATITAGTTVSCPNSVLTANAGTGLSYQWYLNDAPIPGATGQYYQATAAGRYRVAVRNGFGVTMSAETVVTPAGAASVSIVTNPAGAPTAVGCSPLTLQLSGSLTGTPTFQWLRDGQPIGGATSSSYVTTAPGEYQLLVTFNAGCQAISNVIRTTPAFGETVNLGDAASQLTGLRNRTHQVAVNNEINTIAYIHRGWGSPTGTMGANGNAQLFYDVSNDGGTTWTNNQGPLNVTNAGYNVASAANLMAQHPQVAIYNPSGNTNPSNAFIVWTASYGDSGGAAGGLSNVAQRILVGSMQLNGTKRKETVLNVRSVTGNGSGALVQRVRGEFWMVDQGAVNPARQVRLLKGVFNTATDSVEWSIARVFNPPYRGNPTNPTLGDYALAFSPDGLTGWLLVTGDFITTGLTPSQTQPARSYYPALYKTTDGGATWTADANPYFVNLNTLAPLTSATGATASLPVSMSFESDLVVDNAGRPHIVTAFFAGNGAYSITVGGAGAHAVVTSNDGGTTWSATVLGTYNGTFRGVAPASSYSQDVRTQAAITANGERVVVAWAESDPAVTGTGSTVNNTRPELKLRMFNPATMELGPVRTFNTCVGLSVVHHTLPYNLLSTGAGSYRLPVVYMRTNANTTAPHNVSGGQINARLLDDINLFDCDLTATPNNFALNVASALVCGSTPVALTAPAGASSYSWTRNGSSVPGVMNTINVTDPGVYVCTATYGSCTVTSAPTQVTAPVAPNLTVSRENPNSSTCAGELSLVLTNQLAGAQYIWRRGATQVGGNTPSLAVSESGAYTVEVFVNGCSFTSPVENVTINSIASDNAVTAASGSICQNEGLSVTVANSSSSATYQLVSGITAFGTATAGNGGNLALSVPAGTLVPGSTTIFVRVVPNATPACSTTLRNVVPLAVRERPTITRPGGANSALQSSVATGNQWFNADNNMPFAGETNATFQPPSGGNYYVVANGCQSAVFSIPTDVDVSSNVLTRSLKVYPTLTRGDLRITGELPELRRVTLTLTSSNGGQTVLRDFDPETLAVDERHDISALAAGTYVLTVRWGKESATWRVVKQ